MDEIFKLPHDPARHGPHCSMLGCEHLAARFLIENREGFTAWLQRKGIDPADALSWAGRMESVHQVAARLASGLGDRCNRDGNIL